MFSERAKITALAIVHVFETSKVFGDYSAVAVLDDGAGISYGVNQFTHRSGSLAAVAENYLQRGGKAGAKIIADNLRELKNKTPSAVLNLSKSRSLKDALRLAGKTPEMRDAQTDVMEKHYLKPAIIACEGSNFVLPLSLAVIYDSINHGSFEKIRDKVILKRNDFKSNADFETAWISEYAKNRDKWLESIPRLAKTDYRTDFFLAQIQRRNWLLDLPLNVHGVKLTEKLLFAETIQITTPLKPVITRIEPDEGDVVEVIKPDAATVQPTIEKNDLTPTAVVDVPQVIPQKEEPKIISGLKAHYAAIIAFVTANAAAVWQSITGANFKIVLCLLIAAVAIGIIYFISRYFYANAEKSREFQLTKLREERAHEIQMLTLTSAQDPNRLTVRVVPQPILNSDN